MESIQTTLTTNYAPMPAASSTPTPSVPKMPNTTQSHDLSRYDEENAASPQGFLQTADVEDTEERIAELVDKLNAVYNPLNLTASYGYNDDIKAMYVEVKRIDNGEVLRQIPSQEAMRLMVAIREMQSAIFDTEV
ncbi:MAG: flagellar protein FlaG [Helicobacter sp.]|nr:flagellar protein FlaG [Helicobacter sp.]